MIDKVIILSKKINAISEGAELLYYRIYVNADDFGRYHADPIIIKGQIYTLRKLSLKQIENRIQELSKIGLIKLYKNNSELYLEIVAFEKHQTFKSDRPKKAEYPKPISFLENSGNQMDTNGSLSKDNLSKDKLSKDNSSSCPGFQDVDIQLTQQLINLMQKNNPNSSILQRLTPKRQNEWINQCRLLREIDKRTPDQIEFIIKFSQNDSFWKSNILSMPKLREKFDQLWLKAKREDKLSGIKEWLNDKEAEDAKER